MDDERVENYVKFVSETIGRFKGIGDLVTENEISVPKVVKALAEYYDVSLTLNAEYQRLKIEKLNLDLEYQEQYAEWFQESREILASELAGKAAKISLKEIEQRLQFIHAKDYRLWQFRIHEAEAKCDFYLRLRETLNKYDGILTTIARLLQTELRSLSIEDRANARNALEPRITLEAETQNSALPQSQVLRR